MVCVHKNCDGTMKPIKELSVVKTIGKRTLFQNLWSSAVSLRGALEPSQYKHPVLGLLFIKYVSDSFTEMRDKIEAYTKDPDNEDYFCDNEDDRNDIINDRDEYKSENVFWVPEEARWEFLLKNSKQPNIAKLLDDAMKAIERENPKTKGLLYKGFASLNIAPDKCGQLIDLLSDIGFDSQQHKSVDVLGQAYEYFLGKFALEEGKGAGAFYTVESIVKVLVNIVAPTKGQLYEPAIGSGGMVVSSEKFMEIHGGNKGDLSIYGQEYTEVTWKMAAMNMIIRGLDFDLGPHNGDTLLNDLHKDLRADYVMANPPFNQKYWGADKVRGDVRWKYGEPSDSNANYAWMQHMIHHLNDTGRAGIVMAKGAMTSNSRNENVVRKNIIEDDLVECMIALPPKLFINTKIPACIFFFNKNKKHKGKTLFIDARHMGRLENAALRVFDEDDVQKISDTYHAWIESGETDKSYEDILGYCKVSTISDIEKNDFNLSPGRYVGAAEVEENEAEYEEEMATLTDELSEQIKTSIELDDKIRKALLGVRYEV
jgi:type I restriction enzyme M protein